MARRIMNDVCSKLILVVLLISFSVIPGYSQKKEKKNQPTVNNKSHKVLYGQASFYANKFHGRKTASGEIFSQEKLTAACNVLPLGTWIQVTNIKNGKFIVVKTNDRLHPKTKRLIDLTRAGAKKLGYQSKGLTRVKIEVLDQKLYK